MDNKELKEYMDDKFDELGRHIDSRINSQGELFESKLNAQQNTINSITADLKSNVISVSEAKGSVQMLKYLIGVIILIIGVVLGILRYTKNDNDMKTRFKNGVDKNINYLNN